MNKILFLISFFFNVFLFNGILRANISNYLQTDMLWKGDISHFQFDNQYVFALNNPNPQSTNVSYLSQTIDFDPAGFEWGLSLKLLFETNTSSFLRYWLIADQENLIDATSGYYIEVKDRKLQFFCRTEGVDRSLAKTPTGSLMMNPTDISLSVVFNTDEVILKYKKKGSSQEYTWGNINPEPSVISRVFSGVVCNYPQGRAKSFYFRDWLARKTNTDPPEPEAIITLDSVEVISQSSLIVHFSEPVKTSQTVFLIDGTDSGIINQSNKDYTDDVKLTLTNVLEDGMHGIRILNLSNENAGAKDEYIFSFSSGSNRPVDPDIESVCVTISEIMANPAGVSGLPSVEYVELVNISEKDVDLKNWIFYYGDKGYKLSTYVLKAGCYVVLCGKSAFDQLDRSLPKMYVSSFPVLANSGKLLYLEDSFSRLQSVADYTDQWYGSVNKSGCSLEKIDLHNHLSSALNWTASKALRGGTPGVENSVFASNPDLLQPQLVSYEYLHPSAVRLCFNKPMNASSLGDSRNYQTHPDVSVKSVRIAYPVSDQVELQLLDSLCVGDCLLLELNNQICINGYMYESEQITDICRLRPLESKDILINELLYYPNKDEAEFIELYNNSSNGTDLSELYIATRKTDGSLQYISRISDTPFVLEKNQYVCISKDVESVRRVYDGSGEGVYVQPLKLPQFSNSGGTVVIMYRSEMVIDEFPYSPELHAVSSKNQQGISLERKSMVNSTDSPENWSSSSDPEGATPGFENSSKDSGAGSESDGRIFWSDQKFFRPLSQGYEQNWHLHYDLPNIPHKVTIEVYSVNGIQVRALLRNKELTGSGELLWDGKDDNGSVLPIAPYLVYLQYFDAKSRLRKEKYVVTLTN